MTRPSSGTGGPRPLRGHTPPFGQCSGLFRDREAVAGPHSGTRHGDARIRERRRKNQASKRRLADVPRANRDDLDHEISGIGLNVRRGSSQYVCIVPEQHTDSIDVGADVQGRLPSSRTAVDDDGRAHRRHGRRRTDWRLGGRAVRKWDGVVLGVGCASGAAGAIAAIIIAESGASFHAVVSLVAFWVGMTVGITFAFARARPAGLLKITPSDVLWGVSCGLALRVVQGWVSTPSAFPSTGYPGSSVPMEWWVSTFVPATMVAPIVEEFFFRALILVTVYQLLRRTVGGLAAGTTALLVSAGLFVIAHAIFTGLSSSESLQLMFVGAVCAALVLLTGRVWAAVVAHVVFNLAFLLLSVAGTLLS